MAGKTINNPTGAHGYTDLETEVYCTTAPFVASAAIADKVVVAVDTAGNTVATAATNGTASLCVGISQDAIASAQVGLVIIHGVAEDVLVNGAVAAGDILKRSVTTAGRVAATASPAAGEALGVAINASASSLVDVWVAKSL